MYRRLLVVAVLWAAVCSVLAATPPNIVLIISDDHYWADYGFMGHNVIETPNLDTLAQESMVYTRGYVPTSVCRPSLATMITGLFPHEHGITGNDPPGGRPTMWEPAARATMVEVFDRNKTVAEYLGEAGYVSHQSGKWWEGDPTKRGFTAGMTHGDVERGGRHGDEGLKVGREGLEPIADFLAGVDDRPFFIWYAPFLPHTPHNPPDRLLRKYATRERPERVAKYFAMVEWFDETVGELLQLVEDRADNTLVLFVSDNGWVQAIGDQAMSDTRSKMSPYDAGTRTPIMIRWPGRITPGRDDTTLASSLDLAPTMLAAAGSPVPDEMSGLNLLESDQLDGRDELYGAVFAHTAVDVEDPIANLKYRSMVREDGWKLILPYVPNRDVTLMINGAEAPWMRFEPELYNVVDDPTETRNLAAERPEMVEQMKSDLERWWWADAE